MNGPKPIFPLIGIGQTASAQVDQASESGNTAFAENLTAALATSLLTTVPPLQPKTETPIISLEGGLVDGSLDAAASATDGSVLERSVQGVGLFGAAGHVDIGSAGNDDIGAQAGSRRPAQSKTVPDGGASTPDIRATGVLNVTNETIAQAHVGRAPVGVEGVSLEPSMDAKVVTYDLPYERHLELDDTRPPKLVSIDASALPPSGNVVLDQRVANDGDRDVPASAVSFRDRQPLVLPSVDETAPMKESSQQAAHISREDIQRVSARVQGLPLETPSVAPTLDEETQSAKLAPPSLLGLKTVADRTSVHPEPPLPLQPVIERPARPDGGTGLQQDVFNPVASRGESVLPAQRSSADARKHEAFPQVARSPIPTTDPSGPSEDRPPLTGRVDTPSVSVNEAIGKPGLGVLQGGAAQPSVFDGSLRLNAELSGFDRPQPALSVEGPTLDSLRFEAASNLGQSRPQAPLAHAPAGAQIAMQIVRSLPEGVDRLSVHLQPAELGSVDIQLNFEGGGRLSALITAERPETLELLQRDSRLLERSLGDSGLKLSSDGLSFALKQDHQQQQHGQGFQEQAQARQAAFRAGRAYDDTLNTEQAPPATRVDALRLLDIET